MTPDLAIDGSSLSGLSTQWNSANPDFTSPKDWWVDFGSTRAFNYVKYWPRQDVYARLGKDTEVYVSADGLSWGAAIATYSNPLGAIEKIIAFPLQTARFLKLRFLNASEAGGDISISELNVGLDPGVFPDVLPHYLTNNTSHAPFVLSDSLNNGNAWAMLDGGWLRWGQYAATPGAIWQVDMGAKYKIYTYRLHATLVNTQNPKAWTLDGSDDAAAWTTLDSESGKTDWYVGGANCINMTFPLAGTVAYRYYRLNVSETNGDATNVNIGEIYFFGEAFSPKGGSYATVM
jgi:hypothetical protein